MEKVLTRMFTLSVSLIMISLILQRLLVFKQLVEDALALVPGMGK